MLVGIYIRDFMPFAEAEFEPAEDELLLVCGENGTGKSALFEAAFWSVTGSTVRGVPAINVIRHGAKSCEVGTAWRIGNHLVHINRYKSRSENRVTVEVDDELHEFHSIADAQTYIDELIGDPRLLSLCGFFGRKFSTFSRMSARDRADLIDVLAKANVWEEARAQAASDVATYRADVRDWEKDLVEAGETLDVEKEKLSEARAQLKSAKADQKKKLAELRETEKDLKSELAHAEREAEKAEKARASLDQQHERDVRQELKFAERLTQKRENIAKVEAELDHFTIPEGEVCPSCGQRISRQLRGAMQARLADTEERLRKLETEREKVEKEKRASETGAADLVARQQELNRAERAARREESEAREALNAIGRRIEREKSDDAIVRLAERVRALSEESVPLWKSRVEEMRKSKRAAAEQLELAEFWATGFKQIRFLAMGRVAGLLSTLMSRSVQALGFDVDALDCSVWKEGSRKGATRPEVNLIVRRGEWEDPVEALSEGETQRVDLACYLAIGQLVRAIDGYDPGFRVLDEPLAGMDEDGKFRTFQLLAEQLDGQRFVIDHDAHFQDLFREAVEIEHDGQSASIRTL